MRRIPLLLVVMAGVVVFASGSALAAAVRTTASPPVNSSLPTIAGTAEKGQTLTASNGSWGGVTPIAYDYQWQRCNAVASSCNSIGRATNQNYVASQNDVGKTIRVQVTGTNADGKSQALSAATGAITANGTVPTNTKQPDPSGTATAGQTVTVDTGIWAGLKPITFTYQWQSCTAVNPVCKDIAGVTGSSYKIDPSQIGSQLRATVTATNSVGKNSASSNLTTAVLAQASSPVNSTLPAISGTSSVGQTLHASTGSWTGVTSNEFSYQWSRCNPDGNGCASVSGATGQTYGVRLADSHMAIRVNVTAKNANGSSTATSAASVIGVVFTAKFNAVLRTGQELRRPLRDDIPFFRALHREGHGQDTQVDADVLPPDRPADGRAPEQGRPRHERRRVQVALLPLHVAGSRHGDADRIPARRDAARSGLREHPHDEEHAGRDPRTDRPRELDKHRRGRSQVSRSGSSAANARPGGLPVVDLHSAWRRGPPRPPASVLRWWRSASLNKECGANRSRVRRSHCY